MATLWDRPLLILTEDLLLLHAVVEPERCSFLVRFELQTAVVYDISQHPAIHIIVPTPLRDGAQQQQR